MKYRIMMLLIGLMVLVSSCDNGNYIADDGELYCNEKAIEYKGDLSGFELTILDPNYKLSQEETDNLCKIITKSSKEIDNSKKPYLNITYTKCPENYLCFNISEIPDNATILKANLTLIKIYNLLQIRK